MGQYCQVEDTPANFLEITIYVKVVLGISNLIRKLGDYSNECSGSVESPRLGKFNGNEMSSGGR